MVSPLLKGYKTAGRRRLFECYLYTGRFEFIPSTGSYEAAPSAIKVTKQKRISLQYREILRLPECDLAYKRQR
jgi:hypothetical protein